LAKKKDIVAVWHCVYSTCAEKLDIRAEDKDTFSAFEQNARDIVNSTQIIGELYL